MDYARKGFWFTKTFFIWKVNMKRKVLIDSIPDSIIALLTNKRLSHTGKRSKRNF